MVFDGNEKNYELWETNFLGHHQLLWLKDTILDESARLGQKTAEYAELIQFLDESFVTDNVRCSW